jgi:hypothetical protein
MIARRPLILEPAPLASTTWCATASKAGYATPPGPPGTGACWLPFNYDGTATVNLSLLLSTHDCAKWPATLHATVAGLSFPLEYTQCTGYAQDFSYTYPLYVARSGVVQTNCTPSTTGTAYVFIKFYNKPGGGCVPLIECDYAFMPCGSPPTCPFADSQGAESWSQTGTLTSFVNSPLQAVFAMDAGWAQPGPGPGCLPSAPYLTGNMVITS